MLQTQTGACMPAHRPITMTIPGDGEILGAGMEVIAHIGAGTVAGAGVWDYPGAGADHSVGAGVALSDGEAHTGDMAIHRTGADIMIRSGVAVTAGAGAVDIGAMAITTDRSTEEAAEVASVILA